MRFLRMLGLWRKKPVTDRKEVCRADWRREECWEYGCGGYGCNSLIGRDKGKS